VAAGERRGEDTRARSGEERAVYAAKILFSSACGPGRGQDGTEKQHGPQKVSLLCLFGSDGSSRALLEFAAVRNDIGGRQSSGEGKHLNE
jgi:hypothetical protein